MCKNGNCVSKNVTCDGTNDCGDSSDEFDCGQDFQYPEVVYDYEAGEYDPETSQVVDPEYEETTEGQQDPFADTDDYEEDYDSSWE